MNATELRTEIARLAGLLAHEVGNAEAAITVERIGRRIGLKPLERPTQARICLEVAATTGVPFDAIRYGGRAHPIASARKAAYAAMSRHGYSQSEIARWFGRVPSTVHKVLAAMEAA